MRRLLVIGEAARLAGVTPKAIRHYHKLGLLAEPERSDSGYRLYSANDLLRLHSIRRLRRLGLSLKQIKGVLGESGNEHSLRAVLEALHTEVSAEIEELEQRRGRIEELLAREEPDVSTEPSEESSALELIEKRLGEHFAGISPRLREQEGRLWATLDAFEWPGGHRGPLDAIVGYYANHPEECRVMISLEERLAALADLPENSPEVERLAEDYARHFEAGSLPEELSEQSPTWMVGPLGDVFSDLITTNLSPAQRRFVELLGERLSERRAPE